jgi:N-hydroxyarylamine O-acetyltransferase
MRVHDYLRRIGVAEPLDIPLDTTIDTLRRLHVAHRETFLFENLTIQTGGTISVALDDVERKFLDEGRGGYCFEQNTLFAAVLREAGFQPVVCLGRVRRGPPAQWMRTHMVLAVTLPETTALRGDDRLHTTPTDPSPIWLADVGFGSVGLVEPIPLRDGARSTQRGLTYTLRRDERVWVLAMQDATGATMDMYEFSDDPQTSGDVEVANHYTSTHPASVFRRAMTIQRIAGNDRLILRNETLTRYRDGRPVDEPITRARLPQVARELFDVELPAGPFVCDAYSVIV